MELSDKKNTLVYKFTLSFSKTTTTYLEDGCNQ